MFNLSAQQAIPAGDHALPAAVAWMENLVLGEVGTAIAVFAVAGVGFAMLQGRIAPRDGIRVVIGCFILFGAASISSGLNGLARNAGGSSVSAQVAPPLMSAPLPAPPPPDPDPYAGASVPMR